MIFKPREAACIRLLKMRWNRWWRELPKRFCECAFFHRLCSFKDWAKREAKRSEGRGLTNIHMAMWWLAGIWLALEAFLWANANFLFFQTDSVLTGWRKKYWAIDVFMKHGWPVAIIVIMTYLREISHEWLKLRQDPQRASLLIKLWFGYCVMMMAVMWFGYHRLPKAPDSVIEISVYLGIVWVIKRVSRSVNPPKPDSGEGQEPIIVNEHFMPETPRQKRTRSIINEVVRMLIRKVVK